MDKQLLNNEIEKTNFILIYRSLIPYERNALEEYLYDRIKIRDGFNYGIGN